MRTSSSMSNGVAVEAASPQEFVEVSVRVYDDGRRERFARGARVAADGTVVYEPGRPSGPVALAALREAIATGVYQPPRRVTIDRRDLAVEPGHRPRPRR